MEGKQKRSPYAKYTKQFKTMTLYVNQETVNLIALEENLDLKDCANEYLLQTGAKLYRPNPQRLMGWRIMGYSATDISYYVERYELELD